MNSSIAGCAGSAAYYSNPSLYVGNSNNVLSSDYATISGITIAIEVNMMKRTAHFQHNGKLFPFYVTNLPPSIHFGVHSGYNPTLELLSLKMLSTPSVSVSSSSSNCKALEWK